MGRLVVVSNRVGPMKDTGKAGGLAVALVDALTSSGGLWFGWSGKISEEGTFGPFQQQKTKSVQLVQIDMNQADHDNFYAGYANRTLWPVLHYRLDLAVFDRAFENGYRHVNERFASRLHPLLQQDDFVWVHDYHFMPLAATLRQMEVKVPIGFFLHIPFPAPEVLAALPNAGALIRTMLAYDVIGFQTSRDAANFRRFVVDELGGTKGAGGVVKLQDRQVLVKAYPIGIDAEAFAQFPATPDAQRNSARLAKQLAGRRQIVGVDRIDYTKGLPERFRAFARLLEDYPENQGQVSLMQVAPPSRAELDAYIDIRRELEGLTGHVNSRFSQLDWTPIRFLARAFPRRVLAGIYRSSHVGLVTPLRDGMNLVAKEYVAAQAPEDPGVLVLSRFAGAAEGMPEAISVNPYSDEDVARGLQRALTMPLDERRARWQPMFDRLCREDAKNWSSSFVADLMASRREVGASLTAA